MTDYDKEIERCKEKIKTARNAFDKAIYSDKIKAIKLQRDKVELKKEVHNQIDAPAVADHKNKTSTKSVDTIGSISKIDVI